MAASATPSACSSASAAGIVTVPGTLSCLCTASSPAPARIQKQGTASSTRLANFEVAPLRWISWARSGPTLNANAGQSRWLYQGSWVRSGSTAAAVSRVSPRHQNPQRLRRCCSAVTIASGQRASQGQPPSSTSSTGTSQPPLCPSTGLTTRASP